MTNQILSKLCETYETLFKRHPHTHRSHLFSRNTKPYLHIAEVGGLAGDREHVEDKEIVPEKIHVTGVTETDDRRHSKLETETIPSFGIPFLKQLSSRYSTIEVLHLQCFNLSRSLKRTERRPDHVELTGADGDHDGDWFGIVIPLRYTSILDQLVLYISFFMNTMKASNDS
ncbi:hypothetical protein HanRHA438_Chr14g0630411 [Helianthus annuus]|nr:hypothetical protein HanRHA438_Chr14g0630411 [Helianthus annuus]